jgi:hypothetical protein
MVRDGNDRGAGVDRGVYLQRCVHAAERSLHRQGEFVAVD